MVIVVPAFAQSDDRQQKAVAAVIIGLVATLPKNVGQGVDESCAVEKNRCADKEPPDDQLPPTRVKSREARI